MSEVYRSVLPAAEQERHAVVVVHCSDPRYQPHFQNFLREGLKLERYGLVAVPGGAQCLTLTEYLPKFAWSGWRWMKFMVNLTKPARVIFIGHFDCRWYIENRFVHDPSLSREKQIDDMKRARVAVVERFGEVPIELYFATLSGSGTASFERVG
jgi:hypothetical protein